MEKARRQDAPAQFARAVRTLAQAGQPDVAHVCFVLGAGFSHAWDPSYPTSLELFDFRGHDWPRESPFLDDFLRMVFQASPGAGIDRDAFLEIVYQVGMLKKYPLLRHRYVDEFYLELVERELRRAVLRRFHRTARPPALKGCALTFGAPLSSEQASISALFSALEKQAVQTRGDGAEPRVRVDFLTTNYDFLIEAILDTALERPRARDLYRGFTPCAYCGEQEARALARSFPVGHLLKLNGGFDVYRRDGGFEIDYRERDESSLRANPPEIMLPSRAQDYDQPYFQALFPKAVRLLRESRIVVLVGYSFPDEDALMRLLLRQFAEAPADGRQRTLYYIDLDDVRTQLAHARTAFPHASAAGGLEVVPWRGSFSQWCGTAVSGL